MQCKRRWSTISPLFLHMQHLLTPFFQVINCQYFTQSSSLSKECYFCQYLDTPNTLRRNSMAKPHYESHNREPSILRKPPTHFIFRFNKWNIIHQLQENDNWFKCPILQRSQKSNMPMLSSFTRYPISKILCLQNPGWRNKSLYTAFGIYPTSALQTLPISIRM